MASIEFFCIYLLDDLALWVKEEMGEMEGRVNKKVDRVSKEVKTVRLQVTEIHGKVAVVIPPVEYTICNFSALKAQDREWRSPPFYTYHGGYKMCIEVWPNGVRSGRGSHVSIRFYKMQDANTESLKWSATLPVTIHLLNQTTGQWERKYTNNFLRSKPSRDIEESSSHNSYLPHSELAPYVKDDCLCIRVTSFTVE